MTALSKMSSCDHMYCSSCSFHVKKKKALNSVVYLHEGGLRLGFGSAIE